MKRTSSASANTSATANLTFTMTEVEELLNKKLEEQRQTFEANSDSLNKAWEKKFKQATSSTGGKKVSFPGTTSNPNTVNSSLVDDYGTFADYGEATICSVV